jgi:hypothetical protein
MQREHIGHGPQIELQSARASVVAMPRNHQKRFIGKYRFDRNSSARSDRLLLEHESMLSSEHRFALRTASSEHRFPDVGQSAVEGGTSQSLGKVLPDSIRLLADKKEQKLWGG